MKRRDMSVTVLEQEEEERSRLFWATKSPEERLSAVEFLREQFYLIRGYKDVPSIVYEVHVVER